MAILLQRTEGINLPNEIAGGGEVTSVATGHRWSSLIIFPNCPLRLSTHPSPEPIACVKGVFAAAEEDGATKRATIRPKTHGLLSLFCDPSALIAEVLSEGFSRDWGVGSYVMAREVRGYAGPDSHLYPKVPLPRDPPVIEGTTVTHASINGWLSATEGPRLLASPAHATHGTMEGRCVIIWTMPGPTFLSQSVLPTPELRLKRSMLAPLPPCFVGENTSV